MERFDQNMGVDHGYGTWWDVPLNFSKEETSTESPVP